MAEDDSDWVRVINDVTTRFSCFPIQEDAIFIRNGAGKWEPVSPDSGFFLLSHL
jgi:hypothetical protein